MLDSIRGAAQIDLAILQNFKTRPKIWFVNRFFWPDISATSQMLSDLAFYLASVGYEVGVVASTGLYQDGSADLPKFEMHRGVEIHRVKRPRFGRADLLGRAYDSGSMYVRFAWALGKRAQVGDIVVVKTDPPMLSCAIAPVARALGLQQINWLQDLYPEVAFGLGVTAPKPLAALLYSVRDWSLGGGALNVAIGERMAERLEERGHDRKRIAVIPNWCDESAIVPQPDAASALRRAWGLEGKFVVGYSGNLGRAHECETLLAAAAALKGVDDVAFLFVGGGRVAEDLKRAVREKGLDSAFHFQPYQPMDVLPQSLCVPDVHWISLREEMDGLILPSKFYGIAAAGRPTIAVADVKGELAQIVTRHRCGLAVRPGDGQAFADAILCLRNDAKLREDLGRNARRLVEDRLKRSDAFERWEDWLSVAIESRQAEPAYQTLEGLNMALTLEQSS